MDLKEATAALVLVREEQVWELVVVVVVELLLWLRVCVVGWRHRLHMSFVLRQVGEVGAMRITL
jgi:hypothetical protein